MYLVICYWWRSLFYLGMSAILHLLPCWFAAILVSAILVSAILDHRYNGNISILLQLSLRFWCDIFKLSSYKCAVCLFKYKMGGCRFWLKLCLDPVVLSLCVFTPLLYVASLVKYDSYGFKLCALVIMMAELRLYLKCVDFRSGLAHWVAAWSLM